MNKEDSVYPRENAGPVAAAPTGASPPQSPHLAPFVFHGDAREYFRIWIVNTFLTLATCGIFAAWAKVRKRRYLRGNTELLGHRFDYHAEPWRLLVGNAVVAALFLAYMVVGEVYPWVRFAAFIVGAALLPWIVVRSLAFNAHNTSYRGLRFYFHQTYASAALLYLAQGLLLLLTAGLYYPAWQRNRREFIISHHRLGNAFFRFESPLGPFYMVYLIAGAVTFGAVFVGMLITVALIQTSGGTSGLMQMLPFFCVYGLAVYFSRHFVFARLFNHVWGRTRLDSHRFVPSLRPAEWLSLQFVNLAAVAGTCGFLYPWATMRSMRHLAASLHFQPTGDVERIASLGQSRGSALGDSSAEFMGLDFGL